MEVDGSSVAVVRFREPVEVLSCAVLNGGLRTVRAYFVMQVPRDYNHVDPRAHAAMVRDLLGLPEDTVGMMTAAEVGRVFNVAEGSCGDFTVKACATAGLSNHVVAGESLDNYPERRSVSDRRAARLAGTINIAVFSPVPLTDEGRVNMFMPLVEAKSAAMADRGYRETGTTSDSMAVFSPVGGDRVDYTGTGSDIGIAAARAVRAAVGKAMEIRGEHPVMEEPLRLLRDAGYGTDRMAAMAGIGEAEITQKVIEALGDPEVRALMDLSFFMAARADSMAEDGNPGLHNIISHSIGDIMGDEPDMSLGTVGAFVSSLVRYAVVGR